MARKTPEGRFKDELRKDLEDLFPGCYILINDSSYLQGIPDILVLYKHRWAMLEAKASERAARQPNQEWYVTELDRLSFAAFIYPENKEEVLGALQSAFGACGEPRFP